MRPIRKIGKVIGIMVVVALAVTLFGYVVMTLWNWLIPGIFHTVGVITFWQAVGLLVLIRILFHGMGGGHWRHKGGWHGHGGWNHQGYGPWGNWREKWQTMTPEERDKMKSEWKSNVHSWKQKWHDMSPEEKARMKSEWGYRCRPWGGGMPGNTQESPEVKTENPETPNA